VLKTIGKPYTSKTVDVHTGAVTEVTIQPATEEEIRHTVAVMGGEDWEMWLDALAGAGVLAPGAQTVAYSYIGPELTRAIYRDGTIGRAKDDLEATALRLDQRLRAHGGRAFVSVNKAVVTQSSSAIPVVPLYISLLFKVMKEKGLHEGCIEQMYRLFAERLYHGGEVPVDEQGRIRLDERELRSDVQADVLSAWSAVNSDNLHSLADIEGYRQEFLRLFGFAFDTVDYTADVNPEVAWQV
ncbi:MAG: bifunctional NADH-specific enoyl-ACP reductase/trans-2-enoyl-CoA reductase, partial [Alicyclobacillus sp.]|nr:bifunctional NADH-specific enoyl-ACP reductase/trans-2-enoyl-CoA reductase [Alicyclobacillus sp.]